jgi:hypothetical protein
MNRNQGKPESFEQKAHKKIKQNINQGADRVPLDIRGDCVGADQQREWVGGRDGGRGKSEKP